MSTSRSTSRVTRILAVTLTAFLTVTNFLVSTPAHAAPVEEVIDGIHYSADDTDRGAGATITDYSPALAPGDATVVNIPASVTINGEMYAVTTIGHSAFSRHNLTEVTIPDSVTTIDGYAFATNDLTEVTIPDSVITIGTLAFAANDVTELTIPDSVTIVGFQAFANNDLSNVTLGNSVVTISHGAFVGNQLTAVTIPDSVVTIGEYAFERNMLEQVTIPDSVTSIGRRAFQHNGLVEVNLPDSVVTIGGYAFGNNRLEQLTIPESVTRIEMGTFQNNHLTEVTFPATLNEIQADAFWNNRLEQVTIPDSATIIGYGAFRDNPDLIEVRFTGPAPSTIVEADNYYSSLGDADGLIVYYPLEHQATEENPDGYTTPLWRGFDTRPYGEHIVSFETGVAGSTLPPVTVEHGLMLTAPQDPNREGFEFTQWFTDPAASEPFDFDTPIIEDLTLYAGWQEQTPPVTSPSPDEEPGAPSDDTQPSSTDQDPSTSDTPPASTERLTPGGPLPATGSTVGADLTVESTVVPSVIAAGFLALIAGLLLLRQRKIIHAGRTTRA